jgi:Pilus assembly protein, PilO
MKTTDRAILGSVLVLVLIGAFWFLVLAPKRKEAREVSDRKAQLEQQVAGQEQVADFAEQARQEFPKYYGRMVVLGKAVPNAADSASLLVQVSKVSGDAGVEFKAIELGQGSGGAAPPPPPPSPTEGEPTATEAPGSETTTSTTTPAPATEASAANLPIGSTVGPAGLGTLPYDLIFSGHFFDVADFISGMDELIDIKHATVVAPDGRLLTIDGFALTADPIDGFPKLQANFAVTAYATPSDQGLTLGATPGGPAPTPETTQTSAVVSP